MEKQNLFECVEAKLSFFYRFLCQTYYLIYYAKLSALHFKLDHVNRNNSIRQSSFSIIRYFLQPIQCQSCKDWARNNELCENWNGPVTNNKEIKVSESGASEKNLGALIMRLRSFLINSWKVEFS